MPAAKRNDHALPAGHPATVIETQYGTVTIETDKPLAVDKEAA